MINENGRTLAGVVAEVKAELKEFIQTRVDMLRAEMRQTVSAWKTALPLIAIGVAFLGTAWLVFTAALVAILAAAFYPNRFAYFFAFVIVGVAYALIGAICATFALREIKEREIVPRRTLRVLKEDQLWLQSEARTQI